MTVWSKEFSYDPVTGMRTIFHHDQESDLITMETSQPIGDIVELNKQLRESVSDWRPWATKNDGAWHKIGTIPNVVMEELRQKGILPEQDQWAFFKWWNKADNPYRAMPGTL